MNQNHLKSLSTRDFSSFKFLKPVWELLLTPKERLKNLKSSCSKLIGSMGGRLSSGIPVSTESMIVSNALKHNWERVQLFYFFLPLRAGVDRVSPVNTIHQNNPRIIKAGDGGYQRQEKYLQLHVELERQQLIVLYTSSVAVTDWGSGTAYRFELGIKK